MCDTIFARADSIMNMCDTIGNPCPVLFAVVLELKVCLKLNNECMRSMAQAGSQAWQGLGPNRWTPGRRRCLLHSPRCIEMIPPSYRRLHGLVHSSNAEAGVASLDLSTFFVQRVS